MREAISRHHQCPSIAISRHPPKSFEVCTLGVSRLGGLDRSTQLLLAPIPLLLRIAAVLVLQPPHRL
jgi:hypothetical protein